MDRLTTLHEDGYGVLNDYEDPTIAITRLAEIEAIIAESNIKDLHDLENRLIYRYSIKQQNADELTAYRATGVTPEEIEEMKHRLTSLEK